MALTVVQPRTFLQLVQDLYREVGASPGSLPATAIPTTVGVTGEILRLTNYIHDAELEIQNHWQDWKWKRKTLNCWTPSGANNNTGIFTTQGGGVSAQPADVAEWDFKSFFILPVGATQFTNLQADEWQNWRYNVFDTVDLAQPWHVIVMPDNTLRWDLTPDQSYNVTMEYRAQPYDLKLDADVSNMPAYIGNRIIVEWARLKYGMFENAQEQVQMARNQIYGVVDDQGIKQTQGLLAELENDQLPNAKNGRLQSGNDIVISTGDTYGSDGYYGGSSYGLRYW
jgi:hypothetical protein